MGDLHAAVVALEDSGSTVIKRPTLMPWGQVFAIVTDPDGNRIGLKAREPVVEPGHE